MDHDAFLAVIREQSERFLEALKGVQADAPVPSCDGWSADDLLWHLAEVQHFWAEVAAGAPGDDIVEPPRPKDVAELRALGARSGTELLSALASRGGSTPCWSWHPDGGTLRWVARRQAHEALVHRADAQLTAGLDVRPPSRDPPKRAAVRVPGPARSRSAPRRERAEQLGAGEPAERTQLGHVLGAGRLDDVIPGGTGGHLSPEVLHLGQVPQEVVGRPAVAGGHRRVGRRPVVAPGRG